MKIVIVPISTTEPVTIQEVGGKAFSLITLTREGFPVPPGFVLGVPFFDPWRMAVQALPEWQAAQTGEAETLTQSCKSIQAFCFTLTLTAKQKEELDQVLQSFRTSHSPDLFAVRSSSPDEDLESASFAGGYVSSLGVSTAGLVDAIRHTFASSFDERVFLYKRTHGIPTGQPSIAVIIQQQVAADSAGVAFSLNPLNNCYDEALINASHGLGESVVSGAVEPDSYVVDKITRQILESKPGRNGTVTRLNPQGGTLQFSRASQAEACLTFAEALRIVDLLAQVETIYQKPVDIEWALANQQLYLLQARPITTHLPLPDEMVTPPGAPKRLYANSTLIEQGLEEPLSVLGTDFIGYVLNKVGGPVAEGAVGQDGITFTAGGGYYMNISYAQKMGMRNIGLAPGSFGDPRVLAILDTIDMQEYLGGELPPRLKAMRGQMMFKMLPMAKGVLLAYLWPEKILRSYQAALPAALKRFETLSNEGLPLEVQARQLAEWLQFFYGDYGIPMILAAQFAQGRIKSLFKQEANQAHDHLINLGVALPGNKTTEMGEWIFALASADEIQRCDSAEGFLADLAANRLSPEFVRQWDQYMAEFGFRCPREIDPATPRPKEQPTLLFEQLKSISWSAREQHAFFEKARAKRETAYQALYAMALKKGRRRAQALEKYFKTWVMLGGYRETPKHYVIKVIDQFRQCALKMGGGFAAAGRLDQPEQIFDLTITDIDRAVSDPDLNLRDLAQQRSALIKKIKRSHQVARIIDSRGRIYYPPRAAAAEGVLVGVSISPGVVQGRVKVFKHATDKQLLPGEILVARATDPGWTPLFINARGILLEIGGALQHGAVLAREYGIPCVSGLDGVTELLKDGQLVEVDGSNGTVRVLG